MGLDDRIEAERESFRMQRHSPKALLKLLDILTLCLGCLLDPHVGDDTFLRGDGLHFLDIVETAEYDLIAVHARDGHVGLVDVEETTDAYVRAFLDPDEDQHTDTHFRCQTGTASFNWRLVFPITLSHDQKNNMLTLQLWDK